MTLQPPDVVGPGEACALLKMSRPTFSRHKIRPEFPPAAALECGDVYERRAIVAYGKQRETGKPYLDVLRLWRDSYSPVIGPVNEVGLWRSIGAALEISHTTVKRYLQQLGEIER